MQNVRATMAGNGTETLDNVFIQARTRVEHALHAVFNERSELPLYGMLRYFMGYTDELSRPCDVAAGKRIRASLLLLAADMCGGGQSAEELAVAVELFHNFTLIHDDIEDNDEMRRGRPTLWKLWGVNHAINAGDAQVLITSDVLLRAAAIDQGGIAGAAELNKRFLEVIEGQYLDFELTEKALTDPAVTIDAYLEMIRKKTSVLVGAATAAGGLAAGCDATTRDLLFAYGESLGMAYQIADDMASVWGDEGDTGKRAQGDLFERKKTYPVLYARDHGVRDDFIQTYLAHSPLSDTEVEELVVAITATGAQDATRTLGELYVVRAKGAVALLPIASDAKHVLTQLVDTLVRFSPDNHAVD
ncbi:MAG: polyprenyl synthetase family protein [Candidatus Pacebacteria bacterium]|nr:polyprenyl synthetase family protein [Candidatus Paceibacterota bacterium]